MAKVYLAHNFAARHMLATVYVPFLNSHGHHVTSRWLTSESHLVEGNGGQAAAEDFEDIEAASTVLVFANQHGNRPGRGKYVEYGYALRAGKTVVVVAAHLNPGCVFDELPNVKHAESLDDALRHIH